MENITLTYTHNRTDYFQQGILANLQYWQGWAGNKMADVAAVDRERNNIVRAILARLSYQRSRFKEANSYYRQTIRLARQIGDQFNEARACTNLGYHFVEHGQWQRAEVLCCHALKLFEQLDNDHGRAHTENHLGALYFRQEQWDKTEYHLKRACKIWQKMQDQAGLMRGYTNLGALYIDTHRFTEALMYSQKALDYARLIGDKFTMGSLYMNIGSVHRHKKELSEAETYLQKAETTFQQLANTYWLALVQDNLGLVYLEQQKWPKTDFYLKTALETWRSLNNKHNQIRAVTYLVEYELARGNPHLAGDWLDEAEELLAQYDSAKRYRQLHLKINEFRRSQTKLNLGPATVE